MTVQTTESQKSFDGNGIATEFSFDFPFFNKDDIVVVLYDSDGNGTTQTLNSDYTIPGVSWVNGGQVTMTVAPETGETLIVSRILDLIQSAGFRNLGDFRAEVHEDAFDKIIMILQQINTTLGKSLIVPDNFQGDTPIVLPLPVSKNLLRWKEDLSGFENFDSDAEYVNVSGDTMDAPLAGPNAINSDDYMPQLQVTETIDARMSSAPEFDPNNFIDYGLVTESVGDQFDYGSI